MHIDTCVHVLCHTLDNHSLQIDPDPEFSTVAFPNPEEGEVALVRNFTVWPYVMFHPLHALCGLQGAISVPTIVTVMTLQIRGTFFKHYVISLANQDVYNNIYIYIYVSAALESFLITFYSPSSLPLFAGFGDENGGALWSDADPCK